MVSTSESKDAALSRHHGVESSGVDHVNGVCLVPVVACRHLLTGLVEFTNKVRFLQVRIVSVRGLPATTENS